MGAISQSRTRSSGMSRAARRLHPRIRSIDRPRCSGCSSSRTVSSLISEQRFSANDFFAAGHYTIADIALYGYTHLAHECDFELGEFPAVRAWLNRVVDQPGHVPMDWHPGEAQAAQ